MMGPPSPLLYDRLGVLILMSPGPAELRASNPFANVPTLRAREKGWAAKLARVAQGYASTGWSHGVLVLVRGAERAVLVRFNIAFDLRRGG